MITILSPHRDDAAFSLGLMIWQLTQAGHKIRILNCFTISDYAPQAKVEGVTEVTKLRRQEDDKFHRAIGGNLSIIDLPYEEHHLRSKTQDVTPIELVKEIGEKLPRYVSSGFLLAPFSIGNHLDHRICFQVARRSRLDTLFYEDLPYAGWEKYAHQVSQAKKNLEHPHLTIIRGDLAKKRELIQIYKSQLEGHWESAIMNRVEKSGERLWGESGAGQSTVRFREAFSL